jgi:hypothetical protein
MKKNEICILIQGSFETNMAEVIVVAGKSYTTKTGTDGTIVLVPVPVVAAAAPPAPQPKKDYVGILITEKPTYEIQIALSDEAYDFITTQKNGLDNNSWKASNGVVLIAGGSIKNDFQIESSGTIKMWMSNATFRGKLVKLTPQIFSNITAVNAHHKLIKDAFIELARFIREYVPPNIFAGLETF